VAARSRGGRRPSRRRRRRGPGPTADRRSGSPTCESSDRDRRGGRLFARLEQVRALFLDVEARGWQLEVEEVVGRVVAGDVAGQVRQQIGVLLGASLHLGHGDLAGAGREIIGLRAGFGRVERLGLVEALLDDRLARLAITVGDDQRGGVAGEPGHLLVGVEAEGPLAEVHRLAVGQLVVGRVAVQPAAAVVTAGARRDRERERAQGDAPHPCPPLGVLHDPAPPAARPAARLTLLPLPPRAGGKERESSKVGPRGRERGLRRAGASRSRASRGGWPHPPRRWPASPRDRCR